MILLVFYVRVRDPEVPGSPEQLHYCHGSFARSGGVGACMHGMAMDFSILWMMMMMTTVSSPCFAAAVDQCLYRADKITGDAHTEVICGVWIGSGSAQNTESLARAFVSPDLIRRPC